MAGRMEENTINQSPQISVRSRGSFPSHVRFLTTLHDSLHLVGRVSEVWMQIFFSGYQISAKAILTINSYEREGSISCKGFTDLLTINSRLLEYRFESASWHLRHPVCQWWWHHRLAVLQTLELRRMFSLLRDLATVIFSKMIISHQKKKKKIHF